MPRRPNYRQERSERVRNKEARRLEKQQKKDEQVAMRKASKVTPDATGAEQTEAPPETAGTDNFGSEVDVTEPQTEERE